MLDAADRKWNAMRKFMADPANRFLFGAIVVFLAGLAMILFPSETLQIVGYLMGSVLIFFGLFFLIGSGWSYSAPMITLSLLLIAFGILCFFFTAQLAAAFLVLMGIYLLLCGASYLTLAVGLQKERHRSWWLHGMLSLLLMAAGIYIIINPYQLRDAAMLVLGITLVLNSVENFLLYLRMRKGR